MSQASNRVYRNLQYAPNAVLLVVEWNTHLSKQELKVVNCRGRVKTRGSRVGVPAGPTGAGPDFRTRGPPMYPYISVILVNIILFSPELKSEAYRAVVSNISVSFSV